MRRVTTLPFFRSTVAIAAIMLMPQPARAQDQTQAAPPFSVLDVETSNQLGQVISARDAHARARIGSAVLIDIRTPEEWAETGIPASAHAITMQQNYSTFLRQVMAAVGNNRSRPLAIIDRTGSRTTKLQSELRRSGFTQVMIVAEGVAGSAYGPGWIKSGLPLRTESEPSMAHK